MCLRSKCFIRFWLLYSSGTSFNMFECSDCGIQMGLHSKLYFMMLWLRYSDGTSVEMLCNVAIAVFCWHSLVLVLFLCDLASVTQTYVETSMVNVTIISSCMVMCFFWQRESWGLACKHALCLWKCDESNHCGFCFLATVRNVQSLPRHIVLLRLPSLHRRQKIINHMKLAKLGPFWQ